MTDKSKPAFPIGSGDMRDPTGSDFDRDGAISDEYNEAIKAAREWNATPFAITNHDTALKEVSAAIKHIRHLLAVVDQLQDSNRLLREEVRIAEARNKDEWWKSGFNAAIAALRKEAEE